MFEGNKPSTGNFASAIAQSRAVPDNAENDPSVDLPSAFGKTKNPYMQGPSQGGGVELNYRSFTRVFVLWRNFLSCKRCMAVINNGKEDEVILPEVGEYTCPHNHIAEYKDALDSLLAGKTILDLREYFNLHDGTRCVHLSWFEVDAAVARAQEKAEKFKKENAVWPPNIAQAFEDPLSAKKDAAVNAASKD